MRRTSRPIPAVRPFAEVPLRHVTGVDWGLVGSALLLALVGLATVHSASSEMAVDYLPRQALWVGLGLLALAVAAWVEYHSLLDFALVLYALSLAALALVLLVGQEAGGARSWLGVGPWRFQPSEFAKLATILFLGRYLALVNRRHLGPREIAIATAITAAPMLLIIPEPDLGGAAMFVPMAAGMLLVGGVRARTLVGTLVLLAVLGTGIWFFGMQDYQRQRVITFLTPGSDPLGAGYQVRQSKIAAGSGELLGKGYMQGTQSQLRFLPARHTDFVFAVLAEEWGFVGVTAVLGLYALYILSAARVALRARDRGGILVVVGVLSVFSFHVLYNTAMVIGLLPITGIPLPFLSSGGSFTLVNFLATGLILGVDLRRYVNR